MNTTSVIHTYDAGRIGSVTFGVNGLASTMGGATLALALRSKDPSGIQISLLGSSAEMRAFAEEVIRHADITDAKQAELDAEAVA